VASRGIEFETNVALSEFQLLLMISVSPMETETDPEKNAKNSHVPEDSSGVTRYPVHTTERGEGTTSAWPDVAPAKLKKFAE
jgi:hypothetical protein